MKVLVQNRLLVNILHQPGVPLTSVDTRGGGRLNPAELDGAQRGGGCGCRHKELPPFSLTEGQKVRSILEKVSKYTHGSSSSSI